MNIYIMHTADKSSKLRVFIPTLFYFGIIPLSRPGASREAAFRAPEITAVLRPDHDETATVLTEDKDLTVSSGIATPRVRTNNI